jgi:hypothetical protein
VVVPKMRANLAVFSQGRADTVLAGESNVSAFAANRGNLPDDHTLARLTGMNHSQAGWYAGQRGDQPPTVSTPEAHRRLATAVARWLCADLDRCHGPNTTAAPGSGPGVTTGESRSPAAGG